VKIHTKIIGVIMVGTSPYLAAFSKAKTVFRRAGIRPALAIVKREVERQKMAKAINQSNVFTVGSVTVRHIDKEQGKLVVLTNSMAGNGIGNGTGGTHGASLSLSKDGYAINGKPVNAESPYYPRFAALERVVLAQHPRFGIPTPQYKLANGL
jgi:hypothetical protein